MRFNKYLAKTQAMRAACQMNRFESFEAHSKFIAFESQEFLRAWENNNFMAKKHLLI